MAKILIIDDETNLRLMLSLALQNQHEVASAPDGESGLEAWRNGQFDLVLLDWRMPGTDGLEVLRQIRAQNHDAKIVMMTAFGTAQVAAQAQKLGASGFLRKPFTLEILRGAVEAALGCHEATLNGFALRFASGGRFEVRAPNGETRFCFVEAHSDEQAREILANYLWQNAEFPPETLAADS